MRYIYDLSFKMAICASISLAICNFMGIEYGTVAAVIAILSIQNTKRKAISVAKNRMFACLLGLIISSLIYKILGNSAIIFAVFLLIFIPITSKLKIEEGMVAAVVLSNHILLANIISFNLILNEIMIIVIGVGSSFIANFFMPSFDKEYDENKNYIEDMFKILINNMGNSLLNHTVDVNEETYFCELEKKILNGENLANEILSNKLFENNLYYIDYIRMRKNQFYVIKKMRLHFERFYMSFEQTKLIANYTIKISEDIREKNNCIELLEELKKLRSIFKEMELPKSREEFENRAQLIQFLNDLEEFLIIKRDFSKTYNFNKNKKIGVVINEKR